MRKARVVKGWTATYPDPIVLEQGERLWLSGKTDKWEGHRWVWARNRAGKEGWIPDTLAIERDGATCAKAAFSALELTCRRGAALDILDETHGWALCRAADGAQGWVPASHLCKS